MIGHVFGGQVSPGVTREFGLANISVETSSVLYANHVGMDENVWMSHGDHVNMVPDGFTVTSMSDNGIVTGIEDESRQVFGVQYHPEVHHTECGKQLLQNFMNVAGVTVDWSPKNMLDSKITALENVVQPTDHAICAISGGVDSAVVAVLAHKVFGDRLHCVFVDTGLLRFKERERVETALKGLGLQLTVIDDSENMLYRLMGVTDPEEKRKIIGAEFIDVFQRYAQTCD